MKRTNKDIELECIRLYTVENKSAAATGKITGVSAVTVLRILKSYNLPSKPKKSYRKYLLDETVLNNINEWGEKQVYFLGFLMADGHNAKDGTGFKFCLNAKDIDILEKIKTIFGYDGPVRLIKNSQQLGGDGKAAVLAIHSPIINHQLNELGCYHNKSKELIWPDYIPNHLIHHFIRGMIDGDGGISVQNKTSCCYFCGLKNICEKILFILNKECGVNSKIYSCKKKNTTLYSIRFHGNKQTIKIFDWLYKDSTIYLDRKYLKYLEVKEFYNPNNADKIKEKRYGTCPECQKENQYLIIRNPSDMCLKCYNKQWYYKNKLKNLIQ